jgi:hypothetical protein
MGFLSTRRASIVFASRDASSSVIFSKLREIGEQRLRALAYAGAWVFLELSSPRIERFAAKSIEKTATLGRIAAALGVSPTPPSMT